MTAITVLNKSNVPTGPFTRAQIAEKMATGEFAITDLAFVEGLAQWTPLGEVLARIDAGAPTMSPPPAPVAMAAPTFAPPGTPLSTAPAYSYAATMQPPAHLTYAGFWMRFVAYIIDGLILGLPIGIVCGIIGVAVGGFAAISGSIPHSDNSDSPANVAFPIAIVFMELVFFVVLLVGAWLYYAFLESSARQATFGKQVMGLKVTNMAGERLSFGHASGRYFGKIVSGLVPFGMGYIMMVFMERKQALHDLIASTLVVKA